MQIREARREDAAAIARVQIDSRQTTYADILPVDFLASLSHERRTASWHARLSQADADWFAYVAEENGGRTVGFAGGGPERGGDTVYTGELGVIYLLEAYQRRGIGRRLVGAVARRLREQGHRSMLVWVLRDNPSRSFYEALGGHLVREKEMEIGGVKLIGVAYGWEDIAALASQQASTNMDGQVASPEQVCVISTPPRASPVKGKSSDRKPPSEGR